MNIGSLKLSSPIFLAPMAGVTDYACRILSKKMGAGLVYSEFVSADGIIRENQKSFDLIKFYPQERPIGIQIFGNSPDVMSKAARLIYDKFQPDIIDINYGCPVPKVTKRGAGSAALKDLCIMEEITSAVVSAVPEIPITVKMRAGWNEKTIVIPEAGERLEKLGVKAITLHPRTTVQSYSGKANWELIKELKQSVNIPVIGNGDVDNPHKILKMFNQTNCDAIMIGRAALGNPWFFKEAKAILNNEKLPEPCTIRDRVEMCNEHFRLILSDRGEVWGMNLMRKHFGWYIKGFPEASKFREKLVRANSINEMKLELNKLKKLCDNLPK